MKCSKCGNELNFLSGSPYLNRFGGYVKKNYAKCENCGEYFESPEIKVEKKQSALGIVALVLSISVVFSVFGFILGLIDIIKDNKTKNHTCSIIAMALTSIFLFASFILSNGENSESNQEQATQKVEQVSSEPEKDSDPTEEKVAEVPKETEEEYKDSCKSFKYKDVLRNPSDYVGKRAKIEIEISSVHEESLFNAGKYYFGYSKHEEYDMYTGDMYAVFDNRYDTSLKLLSEDIIVVYGEIAEPEYTSSIIVNSEELFCIDMKYVELISE